MTAIDRAAEGPFAEFDAAMYALSYRVADEDTFPLLQGVEQAAHRLRSDADQAVLDAADEQHQLLFHGKPSGGSGAALIAASARLAAAVRARREQP